MTTEVQTGYFDGFASALRVFAGPAVPEWLGSGNKERFKIHRNNVVKGHVDALASAYPVVARLVGEAFFEALAREFYFSQPHPGKSLALYGAGFADFVARFPPAAGVPYLSAVASLERAWLEAYHATDANPLDIGTMSALGEHAGGLVFVKHPAARLIRSDYPVFDIWRANRADSPAAGSAIGAQSQAALITRPEWDVHVHGLNQDAALFAAHLFEEQPLGTAYEATAGAFPEFDLPAALSQLLMSGAFTDFQEGT